MIGRAPQNGETGHRSPWPYVAGMVVLLLLPLLLTALIALRGSRHAEERVMQQRLALAQATALTASAFVDSQLAAIRAFARSPDVIDLGSRPDPQDALARALADAPDWESIELFQADGWGIIGTGPDVRGLNIADRGYVQAALTTGQPAIGPPSIGQRTGTLAVPIVAPVRFINGAGGIVVVWLSMARLDAAVTAASPGDGSEVMLLDADGRVLARSGQGLSLAPAPPYGNPEGSTAPSGGPDVRRVRDAHEIDVLIAHAPVPTTGWSSVVVQPASVAFGPIRRQLRDELLLLGLTTLVIGVLAFYLSRRLSRSYERELAAKNSVDQFISAASHELKTPLTAIKTTAQLLSRRFDRSELASAEWLSEGLHSIDRATTKMTAQINELLDVSRLRQYRPLDIAPRPTELVALIQRIVEEHQQTTDRHRIRLESAVPELMGKLDPERIESVIANLVGNAIKYSPDGGDILVTLTRESLHRRQGNGTRGDSHGTQWATIRVQDEGLGIPEADLPYVFDRFHRAHNVVGHVGGSGIGLATARQVVEQHGGVITVESTEGLGSTFTIRLPLGDIKRSAKQRGHAA